MQYKQHLKYMLCNKTPTVDSILENANNYSFRTQGIAEAVSMHKYWILSIQVALYLFLNQTFDEFHQKWAMLMRNEAGGEIYDIWMYKYIVYVING